MAIAFLVDSSIIISTDWGQLFTEYASHLLTRLFERYGHNSNPVRCFELSHASRPKLRLHVVPNRFRELCAVFHPTYAITIPDVLHVTPSIIQGSHHQPISSRRGAYRKWWRKGYGRFGRYGCSARGMYSNMHTLYARGLSPVSSLTGSRKRLSIRQMLYK